MDELAKTLRDQTILAQVNGKQLRAADLTESDAAVDVIAATVVRVSSAIFIRLLHARGCLDGLNAITTDTHTLPPLLPRLDQDRPVLV